MYQRQQRILASLLLFAWLLAAFANASAKTPASDETPSAAATAEQHTIYLPTINDSRAPLPPAMQAIDAALKAGTIDRETALLYKAQAVLEDPALPAPYRGDVGDDSQHMMTDVRENFSNVSPAAQALLRPYLLPPSSTESWYAQHVMGGPTARAASIRAATQNGLTWKTIDTANGKARVWYHPELAGQATRAQHIAAEIDRYMWAKVAELFGRDLAPDCGVSCEEGGGDGRLDIYMLDRAKGWTGPYGCCDTRTGWLQLGRGATFGTIVWALALAWADTFPTASKYEYVWLTSAASVYAIQYVYPTSNNDPDYSRTNEEHWYADIYMKKSWESLEKFDQSAYLFFLYRAFHDVDPLLVQRVFANAMNLNSLAALDAALNGGLEEEWHYFALFNRNDDSVPMYRDRDQYLRGAWPRYDMMDQDLGKHPFPIAVSHLATDYYHFAFLNPEVRKVTFTNPIARDAVPGGHVWATIFYQNSKGAMSVRFEDWGQVARRTFCKDNPGENITNIILAVSNGQWQDREQVMETDDGLLESEAHCSSDVTGSLTYTVNAHFKTSLSQLDQEETLHVNVRLRWDEESQSYVDDGSTYTYNSSFYSESYSADRSNGMIHRTNGSGGGAFASTGSRISAFTEDANPRLFQLDINNILYNTSGTITYLPSGHEESASDQGRLYPLCGNPSYWIGKETAPNSNTFDMACMETVKNENGTSITSISGTLAIKR